MINQDTTLIDSDVRLILEMDADPMATFAALAEMTGLGERTVARRYRRLVQLGVVRVVARTLPGFEGGVAWMVRSWSDTAHGARLSEALARQPRTRWVRTSRAGDQVVWGLLSSPGRGDPIISAVSNDAKIRRVEIMQLLKVWTPRGQIAVEDPRYRLDDVDRAVMAELRRDARLPNAAIAKRVGVDPATVSRRTHRLVEFGIVYYEVEIDPAVQGLGVDTMIWISMAPGKIGDLAQKLSRHPYCRFVAATSGRFDLVVSAVVPHRQDLVAFVDEELAGYGMVAQEVEPMARIPKRGAR